MEIDIRKNGNDEVTSIRFWGMTLLAQMFYIWTVLTQTLTATMKFISAHKSMLST